MYYLKALMILLFGIKNSLFAVRLTTVIMSILTIILFYLIIKKETNFLSAVITTLLFSSSYWFLNFSRISWITVDGLFFGLLFYFLLKKTLLEKKTIYPLFLGISGTLVFINYMGTRIYLLSGIIIFLLTLSQSNKKSNFFKKIIIFLLIFFITLFPFLLTMSKNKDQYFTRMKYTSIFYIKNPYYNYQPNDLINILKHQIIYNIKGLVFFDNKVSHQEIENLRHIPNNKPAINLTVQILFYIGVIIGFLKKKGGFFFLIYLLNILLIQIMSVYTPNWARALSVLPAIYYFVGLSIFSLFEILKKIKSNIKIFILSITIIFFISIAICDVLIYFNWIRTPEFFNAQQPAISIDEYPFWQKKQYQWIKENNIPFTFYDWYNYEFRNKIY
ncbi:MAG: glycosyltransferase family 39 protein [Patescibacteria group bacterium]|nr:glycosyltransferase family 39 protein [Patescibacteria group bacterium]